MSEWQPKELLQIAMSEHTNKYKDALIMIGKMVDDVEYELCARQYTLDEDEMAAVFYCRDLAQTIIWEDDQPK